MLTDNEIISGAEHCLNPKYTCDVCPYTDKGEYAVQCMAVLIKDQLSLINRQKDEIERLREKNKRLFAENVGITHSSKEIKANAIKEFAERLKASTIEFGAAKGIQREVDSLVKEMVGDFDV